MRISPSHIFFIATLFTSLPIVGFPCNAAESVPTSPPAGLAARQPDTVPALASILSQGIQPRFLKHDEALNLDVWWMMKAAGNPVPIYTSEDGRYLFVAMIYDSKNGGNPILNEQVEQITAVMRADGSLPMASSPEQALPAFPSPQAPATITQANPSDPAVQQSKTSRIAQILARAPYVEIGQPAAPVVYAVVDPQCPYCDIFFRTVKPSIDSGAIRLRLIIVAALPGSQALSLAILGSKDIASAWTSYVQAHTMPVATTEVGATLLASNEQTRLALDGVIGGAGVPLIFYKNRQGKAGFYRGIRGEDVTSLITDVGQYRLD